MTTFQVGDRVRDWRGQVGTVVSVQEVTPRDPMVPPYLRLMVKHGPLGIQGPYSEAAASHYTKEED